MTGANLTETSESTESAELTEPAEPGRPGEAGGQATPPQPADLPGSGIRMVSIDELRQSAARSAPDPDDDRWHEILVGFIDDPRGATALAAELVEEEVTALIALLSRRLARRRETIAETWRTERTSNPDSATEDLRLALRDYREFSRQIAASRNALR
jgi:hypothetical protein